MIGIKSKTSDKELKKTLILFFYNYEKNLDSEPIRLLFAKYLQELRNYDSKKIIDRLDWFICKSVDKFMPKIGELTSIFNKNEDDEIEMKWVEFRDNMHNRDGMHAWTMDIKRILGIRRCDDITNLEMPWLKKEFEKIYKIYKKDPFNALPVNEPRSIAAGWDQ